jgi:subtilisin family serine protease
MKTPSLAASLARSLVVLISFTAPLTAAEDQFPGEERAPFAPFATPWSVAPHDPATLARDLSVVRGDARAASGPVWVHFTDKGIRSNAEHTRALDRAEASLTLDARDRRQVIAQGGPLVDYLDVPVLPEYVAQVARTGAVIRHPSRWLNAVSVTAGRDALDRIAALPFVARITPVARGTRRPLPTPESDADAARDAGGHNLNYGESLEQLEEIQVANAHDLGYSGAGVIVCMLDTGYYKDHEAFAAIRSSGRLIAEYDFIDHDGNTQNEVGEDPPTQHNHGTYTWSALGGQKAGELYGPAYGARFALAKTEDVADEQPIEEDNWLAATEWADSLGARVLSSSLGYLDWYTYEDMDGNTAVTTNAADIAASRNIVVCTAAGNEGTTDWFYIIAPADADSVLAVGASTSQNTVIPFSSHGPTSDGRTKPEVLARGVGTHCATTNSPTSYGNVSGTSLATPLVGGAAAMVIGAHPNWSAWRVRYALIRTADTFANPDNHRGYGRIKVLDAINFSFVGVDPVPAPEAMARLEFHPNPFAPPGTIEIERAMPGALRVGIYNTHGRLVRRLAAGPSPAGIVRLSWDGRDADHRLLPGGIYFLQAKGPGFTRQAKLVLSR